MLVKLKDSIPFLRCPVCTRRITAVDGAHNQLFCTNDECGLNQPDTSLVRYVGRWPVLVDFSKSILSEEQTFGSSAASFKNRPTRHGIKSVIKKLISRQSAISDQNIANFVSLTKGCSTKPLVLIIGGGEIGKGMEVFYDDPDIRTVGFDIYASDQTQFVADAHDIPIADEVFDGVIIQAVLEHVLEPKAVVSEAFRVLKTDGFVYAETPFMQQVHEGAYDFTRFTEIGHQYLFRRFERVRSGAKSGVGTSLLWSIDYFFRGLFRSVAIGKMFKALFFWLQHLDVCVPDAYNIDGASGVFFLGKKADVEISDKELPGRYQGSQKGS